MKTDEMELLVRVAETGSMTLAAKQLHLTPAAVSAAVRRLEESLGLRLFERTTRSVHPTDEGLVILEGCQEVIDRWQRTIEEVRGAAGELVGDVHVSAPADTAYQMLAPVVAEVSEAHPRLRVVVHVSDAVAHLHREAIDMAIRYGALQDSSLSARKLADVPGVLVASPGYLERHGAPDSPEELTEHRALTLQLASVPVTSWALVGRGETRAVELRRTICSDGYLARQWALQGEGIAMKSLLDVIDDLEAGTLVRVLPEFAVGPMPVHVVFPSRRYPRARVRALDAALETAFAERVQRCEAWLAG